MLGKNRRNGFSSLIALAALAYPGCDSIQPSQLVNNPELTNHITETLNPELAEQIAAAHNQIRASGGHKHGLLYDLIEANINDFPVLEYIGERFDSRVFWRYAASINEKNRDFYCSELRERLETEGNPPGHIEDHVWECERGLPQPIY